MRKLTRYKVLRKMGCGWFTASTISMLNHMWGVPNGYIGFMNVVIEFDPNEELED